MPTAGGGAVEGGARGEVGKKRNTDCDTEKHDTERWEKIGKTKPGSATEQWSSCLHSRKAQYYIGDAQEFYSITIQWFYNYSLEMTF